MVSSKNVLKPGFSVMELMVYVLIVGLLVTAAGTMLMTQLEKGKKSATEQTLRSIKQGIDLYYGEVSPSKYPESIEDLMVRPEGVNNWGGPYIEVKGGQLPKDGWGHELVYERTPGGAHPYNLYSYGKNGEDAPEEEWISAW